MIWAVLQVVCVVSFLTEHLPDVTIDSIGGSNADDNSAGEAAAPTATASSRGAMGPAWSPSKSSSLSEGNSAEHSNTRRQSHSPPKKAQSRSVLAHPDRELIEVSLIHGDTVCCCVINLNGFFTGAAE